MVTRCCMHLFTELSSFVLRKLPTSDIIVRDSGSATTVRCYGYCFMYPFSLREGRFASRTSSEAAGFFRRKGSGSATTPLPLYLLVYGIKGRFVLRRVQPASNRVLQGDACLCEHMHVAGTVGAEVEDWVGAAGDTRGFGCCDVYVRRILLCAMRQ